MERTERQGAVYARSEIDVQTDARRIWSVLAQIEQWPDWNPGIREATIEGDLEARTHFQWAAGPSTYSCVLSQVDAPRALSWRGRSMGLSHQHSWHLEDRGGGCQVIAERSMAGVLARLFSGRLQQWLQRDLDTWVRLLKLEAEARATEDDEVRSESVSTTSTKRAGAAKGEAS